MIDYVCVPADELAALRAEVARLQARERELLAHGTKLREQMRAGDVTCHVRQFRAKFGYPLPSVIGVPADDRIRYHVRLQIEEGCEELIKACFDLSQERYQDCRTTFGSQFYNLLDCMSGIVKYAPVRVDMIKLVDALGDTDFVTEGFRQALGVDRAPIAQEISKKNLEKEGGAKREDGKLLKPPGWTPPNIAGVLDAQRRRCE